MAEMIIIIQSLLTCSMLLRFAKCLLTDEFESTEMKVLVLLVGAMLITVIWIPGWFYIMLFVVCSFRILDDLVDIFKEKK